MPGNKPACHKRGTTNGPESHYEPRGDHIQPEEEPGDANKAGSKRGCLDDVESFVPAWAKPPGIVEAEKTEDEVPARRKTANSAKFLTFTRMERKSAREAVAVSCATSAAASPKARVMMVRSQSLAALSSIRRRRVVMSGV
jgi:hypothetical protein